MEGRSLLGLLLLLAVLSLPLVVIGLEEGIHELLLQKLAEASEQAPLVVAWGLLTGSARWLLAALEAETQGAQIKKHDP